MSVGDWDRTCEILGQEYRRRVLSHLLELDRPDGTIRIPEDVLADGEDPEAVWTVLFHRDLPKLEHSGVVRWDRADDLVARGPAFDTVRPLVEFVRDNHAALPAGWVDPDASPWPVPEER